MHKQTSTADLHGTDVAVIGAGPYGLSIAAHLAARHIPLRIFGSPMDSWRRYMPEGMFLKSGGAASSLSAPDERFTLERFCAVKRFAYADWDAPVPVELFADYGSWFQRALVPHLETTMVRRCGRLGDGFRLELETGECLRARRVVVCTGFRQAAHIPEEFRGLPEGRVSHSCEHNAFDRFRGLRVLVLGAGQSALESAALLREAGASPTLVARAQQISWSAPDGERGWYDRLRHPRTPLGIGWRYVFFDHPARPFQRLPAPWRKRLVETVLGPFGAWWLEDRVVKRMPIMTGWRLKGARALSDGVLVQLQKGGETRQIETDHVLTATGYRVSPDAYPFLASDLKREVQWIYGSPRLSPRFESDAAGLFFTGLPAAMSFGPVMRFVAGAHRTAPALADWLAATAHHGAGHARGAEAAVRAKAA